MSNKVTNIYIDTTGFCDDALRRVIAATDVIVEHNGVEKYGPIYSKACIAFDEFGEWNYCASNCNQDAAEVGLWELESIALRCKQEKKEESPPTRNVYIDARELDQEQRRNAFAAIAKLRANGLNGWPPGRLAHDECDADYILFDIFALNNDGSRLFFSGDRIAKIGDHINNPKELTYNQLMSLTR